jgi:putative regulatory protein, FmdB family
MPFYDLRCRECNEEFNIMAKMSDRDRKLIKCPNCGAQSWRRFSKASISFSPESPRRPRPVPMPMFAAATAHTPGDNRRAGGPSRPLPDTRAQSPTAVAGQHKENGA